MPRSSSYFERALISGARHRQLLFLDNAALASPKATAGLPPLIVLHHILVRSPLPLPLSASVSITSAPLSQEPLSDAAQPEPEPALAQP